MTRRRRRASATSCELSCAYDRQDTGMSIAWIIIALALLPALYGLHRLGLWMERKGWIYYRIHPTPGLRGTMSIFQEIVEPEIRHVIEAKDQQKATLDEQDRSDR